MNAIILAGGKGTRMNSDIPKCAYPLNNKPMINYLIETLKELKVDNVYVVVGHKKEKLKEVIGEDVEFVEQKEQLGTAHAVMCCRSKLQKKLGVTLILAGDMPLISKDIIEKLITYHQDKTSDLTILSTIMEEPFGMGRIVRDKEQIIKIVEEKEASVEIKQIKEVNTSIYCINNQVLFQNINRIKNNNEKKEYYLTDIVEILSSSKKVYAYLVPYSYHLMGINDIETLKKLEQIQEDINEGTN